MEAAGETGPKENTDNVLPENNNDEKTPTPPLQVAPKKSKKEDKKKDDKNLEQLMKSLNSLPTLDEKFSMVCKKHVQSAEDLKKMQFYIKQSDKRYAILLKEKEQLQHEFNKTILVKSKLENLCRELQKQNKAIKEESLLKIREEEERRKETQAKFQNTLSEITTLLQQNNEKNAKLRDDNISMSEKFKSVVQQYQLREQQVDKMAKQMALESQLSEAKLQKASLEHQAERERLVAEMEQLKVTVAQYRAKVMELQGTETALRGQLGVYTDKYDEFQNALVKSNQVFGGFKEQMEKMSKKIKKLEKESLSWKQRWETSQTALLDMCGERQASEERAAASARQLQHMQSLCRTLQGERTLLLNTLKEHNIERPALPPMPAVPAPAPPPAPASNTKVDAMAANCAQLRQSLAHLQSQLNVLTNNKNANANANATPETPEPPKPEKQKKSKSKKNKAEKQAQKAAQEKPEAKDESDDTNAKDSESNEATTNGNEENKDSPVEKIDSPVEKDNSPVEKVDDQTLETLIQAINSANINLCDLEVSNDENGTIDNLDEIDIKIRSEENGQVDSSPEVNEVTNKINADVSIIDTKLSSNDEVPQISEVKPIAGDCA
ncbi:gamma-taxilin [Amyelois transitella]|uniref:gamma-taxilin n=1 Tax=Amyelois transitella TaxID=680683 RepID=UPI00067C6351|nr:gamma-taxilin [Amyelois transitella]